MGHLLSDARDRELLHLLYALYAERAEAVQHLEQLNSRIEKLKIQLSLNHAEVATGAEH